MPDHAATAVKLGAAGFRVFPLQLIDGKVCRINGWPEKASTDPHEIVDMFTGRDVIAVAIATGDDFTVVDVDVPGERHTDDGRASLEAAGVGLPATLTVTTSSGGSHHFYRTVGGARKTVAGVVGPNAAKLPGVDVRGAGGFVKVHDPEALLAGLSDITDVPDWLPLAGARSERTGKPDSFMDDLRAVELHNWGPDAEPALESLAVVDDFMRTSPTIDHDDLLSLAEDLADVVSAGFPGAAWAVEASRDVYVNDAPSGGDWGSAFDAALFGLDKLRLPLHTFPLTKAERAKLKRRSGKKAKRGKPRALADLMTKRFPELGWVVEDMIPEGTSILVSAPKIGKSLLALDVAVACATGRDAFGGVPTGAPRPVLYLDLESGERRLQSRVLAQGWDEFGSFQYHLDSGTAVATLQRFMRKHRGKRPLAILDTLAAVMTDRGDRSTLLKHEYDTLKPFQQATAKDPGSAIVVVHHTRKLDSTDPLAMASGTHGTTGAVDHVLLLARPSRMERDGVLSRVSRDVEDREFEIRLRGARWYVLGGSAEEAQRAHEERERQRKLNNLSSLSHGLIQVIEAAEGATLSVETIFSRYDGASDRHIVSTVLPRLARNGLIEKVGRGAYRARTPNPTKKESAL